MIVRGLLSIALLCMAMSALAHFPTLQCEARADGEELHCLAGFSDGSPPGEVELQVYTYDEELIEVINTDSEGAAVMAMPEGEFYIVFDADHESPAEFDYAELE
ncbi:MAG: hypothetical protein AAF541_06435 [Pseudomonadota bacterium]